MEDSEFTVYALMVEQQLEGHPFMDVFTLHKTRESAEAEAQKRGMQSHKYYVEELDVKP